MFKRFRSWFRIDIQAYANARNLGLIREAFTARGYPIELWSDAAIERAFPAMFAAIADASGQIAKEQLEVETG